jgi:dihydroorotase
MGYIQLNGTVVFPDGPVSTRLTIDSGEGAIVSVERSGAPAPGRVLLFPGFIDIHVHARQYPRPIGDDPVQLRTWEAICAKETFLTSGRAAINGGVTLYAAMPNDPIPPSGPNAYARKVQVAAQSQCPVIVFGMIAEDSEPWADIPYKLYLDVKGSRGAISDWGVTDAVLKRFAGCHVFFHAEDPLTLEHAPKQGPRWLTRPAEAEAIAVDRILDLTSKHGLRTHICHVSTERAVNLITDFNRETASKVTCEVTPHHLYFSVDGEKVKARASEDVARPELLGSNPPLRPEADRRFLVEALRFGLIDVLATDHAPHTLEDKSSGAPGVPHLDTLGAFSGWLIVDAGFAPQRIAQVLAEIPGKIMAPYLSKPHGVIEPGAVASFTEIDLDRVTEVQADRIIGRGQLETRCGWSPFDGTSLPAAVSRTVLRGREHRFG